MATEYKNYHFHCSCGNVDVLLKLSNPIESYTLRACDCDYCIEKSIAYLSDQNGSVEINYQKALDKNYQGSQQAQFNLCPDCHDMIFVGYEFSNGMKGALNGALIPEAGSCEKIAVSPKKLGAKQKLSRWQQVWMPILLINRRSSS